jgi:hypothetical protein
VKFRSNGNDEVEQKVVLLILYFITIDIINFWKMEEERVRKMTLFEVATELTKWCVDEVLHNAEEVNYYYAHEI